ncbi:type 1 glutamine amidotransferase [Pendulispora brunnea]|uniref:Type 1 glutamine amidotransferase n=1 Tax=Pendulispora brunnea TaxID=2905690 RepID=A0ABZ2K0B7_9BACT
MRIHFVIHESFEAPGAFETWVRDRGYTPTYSKVYTYEPLPQSVDGIDLLVVLGGPQSASTTKEECPHFDAAAERSLISKCIGAKKAVLGVCLGSQLLGEALGAKHERSPHKEIGSFPITLTAEGRANAKFAHFPDSLTVAHWHGDMPGLTKDAKVIASSEGCPRQIIEYGNLVYGFQCHMEFTKDVIESSIAHSERELTESSGLRFVQRPDVLRANDYRTMNEQLFVFLDNLVAAYESQE